jgi:pilus assembly protein Flp/PilA
MKNEEEQTMMNKLKALLLEEEGQGMTEYGLILGLIAVAAVGALVAFGDEIKNLLNKVKGELATPTTGN